MTIDADRIRKLAERLRNMPSDLDAITIRDAVAAADALDAILADNERLRAHLTTMEFGYRERCNYCYGQVHICDACPSGGCRAPSARKALSGEAT